MWHCWILHIPVKADFPWQPNLNYLKWINEISPFRDDRFSQSNHPFSFNLGLWTRHKYKPFSFNLGLWTRHKFSSHRFRRNYNRSDLPILFLGVRMHGIVRSLWAHQINKTSQVIYLYNNQKSSETSPYLKSHSLLPNTSTAQGNKDIQRNINSRSMNKKTFLTK